MGVNIAMNMSRVVLGSRSRMMLMLSEADFSNRPPLFTLFDTRIPLLQRRELCIVVDIENDVWGKTNFSNVVCCILYIVYCMLYVVGAN